MLTSEYRLSWAMYTFVYIQHVLAQGLRQLTSIKYKKKVVDMIEINRD